MAVADKARITIDRDPLGQPLFDHDRRSGFDRSRHGEIGSRLGRNQDRGADIDGIKHLNYVLLFAIWVRWNGRCVLKVELPTLHRLWTFQTLMGTLRRLEIL
jgi:hypothetical protein